jgi:hypothetical protein
MMLKLHFENCYQHRVANKSIETLVTLYILLIQPLYNHVKTLTARRRTIRSDRKPPLITSKNCQQTNVRINQSNKKIMPVRYVRPVESKPGSTFSKQFFNLVSSWRSLHNTRRCNAPEPDQNVFKAIQYLRDRNH